MKSAPRVRVDDNPGRIAPIFVDRATSVGAGCQRVPVTHDFAALAFYVDGGSRIEQRGTWRLEAGDVMIVPAGEPHRLIESRRPDMWRLGLCAPCLAADGLAALLEPFERVRDGASPVIRIPTVRHEFLESLFRELGASARDGANADLVRHSLLTLIVDEVARVLVPSPAATRGGNIVSDTLRFIERHCLEPLTLTAIAAAMNRTPSYITTTLTRATGRSAVGWIIAGRMAEARRRLLHSDERVEIIAERVGYADPTHFIRLFRRMHGATPARWRARQRDAVRLREGAARGHLHGERMIQHRRGAGPGRGR